MSHPTYTIRYLIRDAPPLIGRVLYTVWLAGYMTGHLRCRARQLVDRWAGL